MKKILLFMLCTSLIICKMPLLAQEKANEEIPEIEKKSNRISHTFNLSAAYYFPHHYGFNNTGWNPVNYDRIKYKELENRYPAVAADPGGARNDFGTAFSAELKAYYTFGLKFPVMTGNNAMTKDNNITLKARANLSPVSFEAGPYLEITPIAFLVFEFGSKVGTGWDLAFLKVNGLAINKPDFRFKEDDTRFKASTGAVVTTSMQAKLQFDTGAIWKGNWTHVVLVAVEKFDHLYFSGARNNQYWRWEHDEGENQNGFIWLQTFVVGYMMPTRPGYLDLIGILIETEQRLTGKNKSTMDSGGWGSDFIRTNFGPMLNFQFTENYGLAFILQFRTERQYTDNTVAYRYFEHRKINENNQTYVQLYRFALSLTLKF